MKVKIHTLFEYLLETTAAEPEAFLGFSLSKSPKLGDYLDYLDPNMSLDWNQRSFHGLPELREHVLRLAGLRQTCKLDDVLITAGAAEANYLALRQLLEPGDEIVVERPGWPQAEVLAKAENAKIVLVQRKEQDGWCLPIDALKKAVTPRTKIIFLTNPNNPTGHLLTETELRSITEIASRVGAWLIVDEVYAGLEWVGNRAPSIAGLYERGITTGSVSKALGLQGLRTGWMICQSQELIMDAVILRENSSEIMNVMGEVLAEIALRPENHDTTLERARADGIATLNMLNEFIVANPLLSWVQPQAGLIGLARLGGDLHGDEVAKALLDPPYRTFVLPGSAYGEPKHIRLGVGGGEDARLALGLSRLSDLLGTLGATE